MPQESNLKEKFQQLAPWMPSIIESVKKDIKNEHLKQDYVFIKKYLSGKNINKVSNEEFAEAYNQAIQDEETGEKIAEFIAHKWIFRHSEMYHFFEQHLQAINPNFTEIKELTNEQSEPMVHGAVKEFGPKRTLIFSVFNDVRFPKAYIKKLEELAHQAKNHEEEHERISSEKQSAEALANSHAQEIARITDKYEKKLLGLQKKYTQDVDMLKKQIANLQRKLV